VQRDILINAYTTLNAWNDWYLSYYY
jgi:hypothetical protein